MKTERKPNPMQSLFRCFAIMLILLSLAGLAVPTLQLPEVAEIVPERQDIGVTTVPRQLTTAQAIQYGFSSDEILDVFEAYNQYEYEQGLKARDIKGMAVQAVLLLCLLLGGISIGLLLVKPRSMGVQIFTLLSAALLPAATVAALPLCNSGLKALCELYGEWVMGNVPYYQVSFTLFAWMQLAVSLVALGVMVTALILGREKKQPAGNPAAFAAVPAAIVRPAAAQMPVSEPVVVPAPILEGELCRVCGNRIKPGADFCTQCGTLVAIKETPSLEPPAAPEPIIKPETIEESANEPVPQPARAGVFCINCGEQLDATAHFCRYCGAKVVTIMDTEGIESPGSPL